MKQLILVDIFLLTMKQRVFSVTAELGTLKSTAIPSGPITVTLRLGRVHAASTYPNSDSPAELQMGLKLQVNVDSSALQSQRCTLTLTRGDKTVIGIALVSLPRGEGEQSGTYKLTQSPDKRAELSVKFTIVPMQSVLSGSKEQANPQLLLLPSLPLPVPKISERQHMLSAVSKIKSAGQGPSEEQQTIKVLESELTRLKKQKDTYYQLYQIEKNKSEVAGKFITNFINKMKVERPDLIQTIAEFSVGLAGKNKKQTNSTKLQESQAAVQQLEQANKSLHRQVEEYKKINQQLRNQLCNHGQNNKTNNLMPAGGIQELFPTPSRSNFRPRNSNILSSLRSQMQMQSPTSPSPFAEVDLKKWLQESVGQRQELQKILRSLPKDPSNLSDGPSANLTKVRAAVNKAYVSLLSQGNLSRESILGHKREINSILEQILPA